MIKDLIAMLKWSAAITGVVGELLIALNLSISGYAFILFFLSAVFWVWASILMRDRAIFFEMVVCGAFAAIGIYCWLITGNPKGL